LLADRERVLDLLGDLGQQSATFQWLAPGANPDSISLEQARDLRAYHRELDARMHDPGDLRGDFLCCRRWFYGGRIVGPLTAPGASLTIYQSSIGFAVDEAEDRIVAVEGTSRVLGLAGAAVALVVVAAAGGNRGKGNDSSGKKQQRNAAVTVYDLRLEPKQEVPRIKGLRAHADGNLTLDVTRDTSGAITSGEAVFYFNYDFPGSVTVTGLHVHQGEKGENGPIVIDSGIASFTDADGDGNVTAVVTGVSPTLLQAILAQPRGYYVNLHTSVNPGGAIRDQLETSRKKKHDD